MPSTRQGAKLVIKDVPVAAFVTNYSRTTKKQTILNSPLQ